MWCDFIELMLARSESIELFMAVFRVGSSWPGVIEIWPMTYFFDWYLKTKIAVTINFPVE
uniref:Uncharacterized protein ORF SG37 n=1 Tax=Pseudomonas aeruginosa TaxID=287 RepID=Q8GPW5_PSEAI|nr:hypothetical protein [Pseudomonas aeruginosa]